MKNFFLTALFAICSLLLNGQDEALTKNTLSVGLNWVSFESPVKGVSVYGEYAYSINKYI